MNINAYQLGVLHGIVGTEMTMPEDEDYVLGYTIGESDR
jgi:hypothetical protein